MRLALRSITFSGSVVIDIPSIPNASHYGCIAPMNTLLKRTYMSGKRQPYARAVAAPTIGPAPAIDAK
jgi:hypothetical protein